MELLANSKEPQRPSRPEEQRIKTNITTQVNKNTKIANEKLVDIY